MCRESSTTVIYTDPLDFNMDHNGHVSKENLNLNKQNMINEGVQLTANIWSKNLFVMMELVISFVTLI